MKTTLVNAFSLQMLPESAAGWQLNVVPVADWNLIADIHEGTLTLESAIGHADTARALSNLLDTDIAMNRTNVTLDEEHPILIAQLTGGRLPEGSTKLPEGYSFHFYEVKAKPLPCQVDIADPADAGCQICGAYGCPGCYWKR